MIPVKAVLEGKGGGARGIPSAGMEEISNASKIFIRRRKNKTKGGYKRTEGVL